MRIPFYGITSLVSMPPRQVGQYLPGVTLTSDQLSLKPRFAADADSPEKETLETANRLMEQAGRMNGWYNGKSHYLGDSYYEPTPTYIKALALREKVLGPKHPLVIQSLIAAADSCTDDREDPLKAVLLSHVIEAQRETPRLIGNLAESLASKAFSYHDSDSRDGLIQSDLLYKTLFHYLETKEGKDTPSLLSLGGSGAGPLYWGIRVKSNLGDYFGAIDLASRKLALTQKHKSADQAAIAEARWLLGEQKMLGLKAVKETRYGVSENQQKDWATEAESDLKLAYNYYHGSRVSQNQEWQTAQESEILKNLEQLRQATGTTASPSQLPGAPKTSWLDRLLARFVA